MTKNEQMASQVGQEKPYKDGQDVHEASHGSYANGQGLGESRQRAGQEQAKSTVQPFGSLR